MVIVSDYLQHDTYAVNVFLKFILQHLESTVHQVHEVVILSEGAARDFKQHFLPSGPHHTG